MSISYVARPVIAAESSFIPPDPEIRTQNTLAGRVCYHAVLSYAEGSLVRLEERTECLHSRSQSFSLTGSIFPIRYRSRRRQMSRRRM